MILVLPMGGSGARFIQAGYVTPKPLLLVKGHPLIWWALQSYEKFASLVVAVLRPEHLQAGIQVHLPRSTAIHILTESTTGPVQTCLVIHQLLNTAEEILIADCDSFLAHDEMRSALAIFRSSHADGGVTVRVTTDPMCSYAVINEAFQVVQTAEKQVISSWSTTGPYWWRHGQDFLAAVHALPQERHVSPLYNWLIQQGRQVKAVPVTTFRHLGTPADLEAFAKEPVVEDPYRWESQGEWR